VLRENSSNVARQVCPCIKKRLNFTQRSFAKETDIHIEESNMAQLLASSMKFYTKRFLVSITEITISKHAGLTTQRRCETLSDSSRLVLLFRGGGLLFSADTSVRNGGYFCYRPDDFLTSKCHPAGYLLSDGGYYRVRLDFRHHQSRKSN